MTDQLISALRSLSAAAQSVCDYQPGQKWQPVGTFSGLIGKLERELWRAGKVLKKASEQRRRTKSFYGSKKTKRD